MYKSKEPFLIRVSKFFFIILFLYFAWFQFAVREVRGVIIFAGLGIAAPVLLYLLKLGFRVNILKMTELNFLIAFFVFCLVTGPFIITSVPPFKSGVTTLFETLVLMVCINVIISITKNIDFFFKTIIFVGTLIALNLLINPSMVTSGSMERLTVGSLNPNTVGIFITAAMFCVLYFFDFQDPKMTALFTTLIGILAYATILTGSRKSFICQTIVLIFWMLFIAKKRLKHVSTMKKFGLVVLIVVVATFLYSWLTTVFLHTSLFERLMNSGDVMGDQIRIELYNYAWQHFKENPIAGIGYNQFRIFHNGLYSHSVYAELISCTGAVGTILYFCSYISVGVKLLKKRMIPSENDKATLWIGFLITMLILGTGVILYYSIQLMTVMSIMFSYANMPAKTSDTEKD